MTDNATHTPPPPTTNVPDSTPSPLTDAHTPAATTPNVDQQRAPTDPKIAVLFSMFPDYDELVLQSILESVGGDQDRAIDVLLGMNDPNYKNEAAPEQPAAVSQTDLDEQFARQLMLEEQQQQQQAWEARNDAQRQQRLPPRPPTEQPPQSAGAGGDTMAEFQQQFNKIAESGKKTFGNIFSKVKAKIQEMDQPKSGQGSNQPSWGGTTSGYDPARYEQQQHQAPYPSYSTRPQTTGPTQPQQPAYYDPNPHTSSPGNTSSTPPTVSLPHISPLSGIQGYDTTPEPTKPNTIDTTPRSPQTTPSVNQSTPIDGGKLGLLPKRPVSLLRSQSPPGDAGAAQPQTIQRQQSEQSYDSEGLDYAENPFEDKKK